MASTLAHAAVGLAIGTAFAWPGMPRRFWIASAVCATLPDVDALGRPFGYLALEAVFGGHRAFTHSWLFASVLGPLVAYGLFAGRRWDPIRWRVAVCVGLATASHGLLDAHTAVGEGVAFLAPFSNRRFAFEWRPIAAVGPEVCGWDRLWALAGSELLWVGVPTLIFVASVSLARRSRRSVRPAV